tara:strand:- start:3117 stop:4061 length:945 start_codon:yes stop_codon:yes gene_type:complete
MADNSGFPYCTKWKNYRYPLTRLTKTTHYTVESGTGRFAASNRELDIYIEDDWHEFSDSINQIYKIIMHNGGIGTGDSIKTINRPRTFMDGNGGAGTDLNTGAYDVAGGDLGWVKLANTDGVNTIDVESSLRSDAVSIEGQAQSLYTIAPGVHFGFMATSSTFYSTDEEFSWKFKTGTLNGLPKIMNGTHYCWFQQPVDAGDTVATDLLPPSIANNSFTVLHNVRDIIPKRRSGTNWGLTIHLEGSVDKVNWKEMYQLTSDTEVAGRFPVAFDSNALDGYDMPYKRLKLEFPTGSGSSVEMFPYQYTQLAIVPN